MDKDTSHVQKQCIRPVTGEVRTCKLQRSAESKVRDLMRLAYGDGRFSGLELAELGARRVVAPDGSITEMLYAERYHAQSLEIVGISDRRVGNTRHIKLVVDSGDSRQ